MEINKYEENKKTKKGIKKKGGEREIKTQLLSPRRVVVLLLQDQWQNKVSHKHAICSSQDKVSVHISHQSLDFFPF